MIHALLLLLLQTGLEVPPLGYFPARDGRVYPLYGMRGNLLLGEPLEEGTEAAVSFEGMSAVKTNKGIHIGGQLREAGILACRANCLAWLSGQFTVSQDGRFVLVSRTPAGWERIVYDGRTLQALHHEPIDADAAAIDSGGRLWTASGATLSCGDRQWEMEAPVSMLFALREGWVLARAGERLYGAQCHAPDLTLVPEPAP
jgi:hypothetical protein